MTSVSMVEAGERLELRRVWLTNMQLLGFNTAAYEEKFKVDLSTDTFAHINKKGSEVVTHFLFSRLDSHTAYEEFRDCWPIFDKKQETQFRRACSNWLAKIAKEEPSSRLPRLASSLLLSPGGDKFYYFLFRFSSYVLKKVCLQEAKPEEKHVVLSSFITSPEGHAPALKDVAAFAVQAHTVRHTQNVVKRTVLVTKLHKLWETYASDLIEEYRSHAKEIKQLKKKLEGLQEEKKRWRQASLLAGSSPRRLQGAGLKPNEKILSLSAEVAAQKRHSRMEKVRGLWRSLEGFYEKSAGQREVVSSVLHGQADAHSIDAKDIVFQVPDMLLGEYEALNREGKVGNTYEAGKLNIISLVQLWNCSLKVLRDKLLEKELPSFEAELQYVNEAIHTQRANLTATKNLRVSLLELQSSLETSVAELEKNLRSLRKENSLQGGEGDEGAPVLHIPPIAVPSLGLDLLPPSPKKPLPTLTGSGHTERQPPLPVNLSLQTDEVSTPEAVHNISRSVHHASCQHRLDQPPHSASKQQQQQPHTSKLRTPQVKLGKPNSSLHLTPRTGDLSIFNDDSPARTTTKPILTSTLTPVSVSSSGFSTREGTRDRQKSASKSNNPSSSIMVDDSSKVKLRPLKPKVSKSSAKVPPKSPLISGEATLSKMPQSQARKLTKPRSVQTAKYQSSPLAVHTITAASSGNGRGQMGRAGPLEDKENTTPLLVTMPKAHDILAEQIAAAVADGGGLVNSDGLASTPEGQVHSFADPISAMGTDAFVVRDKIPRTPSGKQTQGSANSSMLLQSPSLKLASPPLPNLTTTLRTPSPLATDLSTKLNLSSLSPFTSTTVQRTPAQNISTSQSLEHRNLIDFPPSPFQDSRPNLQQKEGVSVIHVGVSSNKSPPSTQLPQGDSTDAEQSVQGSPTTSQHTSLNESHSTMEEKGEDGERESGEEVSVSEQNEESHQPVIDHSCSTSSSTTQESSPLKQEPMSEGLASQHTTPTQDVSRSLQSNDSVASSLRKIAFSTGGVAPPPALTQFGLISPGSLDQGGLMFQTPPSASSYQLMSELPPTPFQDANFDLDSSSSQSEHEEEEHELSHERGNSFDSSYGHKLQEKVEALISQEDIEISSNYDLDGVISRVDVEEPQSKLVDIAESPLLFPNDVQLPLSHHGVLDSSHSLKVDDLINLDSPSTSIQFQQPSPSLESYHSPQVGFLVDIGTPGSNLSARPLLTSTAMQRHQSSTNSQGQRGQFFTPMSDDLLPYMPSHSGTQSGALTSASASSGQTWPSLKSAYSGSPFLISPPNTVSTSAAEKQD